MSVAPRIGILCLALLCAGAGSGSGWAGTRGPVQPGLSAGRLVLTPWVATSAGYDTNLFRAPECPSASPDCVGGPEAEYFSRTTLGLGAYVPIRNSFADLRYQLDKREYRGYQPKRPREQTFAGRVRLNFGTGDALIVTDTYTLGSSDVRNIDEGGELVFRDAPYDYNRAEVLWQRLRPRSAGFIFRVAHVDLKFVEDSMAVPFFDYNGLESSVEYRHPIPGQRWLRGYFDTRRFDHFEPGSSVSFRQEDADTLQVGIGGLMGRRGNSFEARAGYGHYALRGQGAEFQGLVYNATLGLAVGGRTRLTALLWRRPLPSNFPTYYIVNSLRISAERNVARNVMGGVGFEHYRNQYLDPLPSDQGEEIRKDQRYIVEGYLEWAVHPRLAFRLAGGHEQRVSNFPDSEYDTTGASFGLRLGWF